jgi:outer membrane protein assembly factor BamE (lipoprotein component of BamABCDE complex)
MHRRALACTALCVLLGVTALQAAETRFDDVLYLDDGNQAALYLKALHRTPITFSRNSQSVIAYLAEGQPVEVLGLGDEQYYVSARMPTGPLKGWVGTRALEAPPEGLVSRLRASRQQAQAHRESIERHEVTEGMTRAEVRASLGKPDRESRLHTQEGERERWFYTTYTYAPYYAPHQDSKGAPGQLVSYRREPSGHRTVTFQNGAVVEISEERDERPPSATVRPPNRFVR